MFHFLSFIKLRVAIDHVRLESVIHVSVQLWRTCSFPITTSCRVWCFVLKYKEALNCMYTEPITAGILWSKCWHHSYHSYCLSKASMQIHQQNMTTYTRPSDTVFAGIRHCYVWHITVEIEHQFWLQELTD